MNPFLVLNVPPTADDATVREAYLNAIRVATPETNPRRFQAINEAYHQVKDAEKRREYLLFDMTPPGSSPLDTVRRAFQCAPPPAPLPWEQFKEFLRSCAKPGAPAE